MKKKSQLEETLIKSAMLNLGIVPYTYELENINCMLENSSVEEKRKMHRKFRKLWKKLDKVQNKNVIHGKVQIAEKSKLKPSSQEKMRRRKNVLFYVQNTLVKPIIDSIESMTISNSK
jgi:hypothetical protein